MSLPTKSELLSQSDSVFDAKHDHGGDDHTLTSDFHLVQTTKHGVEVQVFTERSQELLRVVKRRVSVYFFQKSNYLLFQLFIQNTNSMIEESDAIKFSFELQNFHVVSTNQLFSNFKSR